MIISTDFSVADSPVIWWENLLQSGTVTATSGADVGALANGYTTDPWRADAMPATVTVTLSGAAMANAVCFAGHDMHAKGVIAIVERFTGGAWVQVATGAPKYAGVFILSFPCASADQWRVRFTGANTFRLAVMTLGLGLMVPGIIQPPHTPLYMASEVELIGASESGTGEFLQADFKRSGGRADLDFGVQYPAFIKSDRFLAFRDHFNRGRPFFVAIMPRHDPRDVGYLWRGGANILPAYSDAVFMPFSLEASLHVG